MDHLNWGVLGASKFALEHLTPAMQLSKNNRFLALATRSKQKAAPFVRLEPGIDVFDDYDQLLADNRINAVYIPLPNTMHVDWTKRAIHAGKHVLCEKPIAMKSTEINELIEDFSFFDWANTNAWDGSIGKALVINSAIHNRRVHMKLNLLIG